MGQTGPKYHRLPLGTTSLSQCFRRSQVRGTRATVLRRAKARIWDVAGRRRLPTEGLRTWLLGVRREWHPTALPTPGKREDTPPRLSAVDTMIPSDPHAGVGAPGRGERQPVPLARVRMGPAAVPSVRCVSLAHGSAGARGPAVGQCAAPRATPCREGLPGHRRT